MSPTQKNIDCPARPSLNHQALSASSVDLHTTEPRASRTRTDAIHNNNGGCASFIEAGVGELPKTEMNSTTSPLHKWSNLMLTSTLIFGGCCANVFALEAIIKDQPSSGPMITLAQFILTAIFTFPDFFYPAAGPRSLYLRPRAIPLRSWLVYTAFFISVNLLNNWAFAYKISVPLHIILRSGGPVASMVIGYMFNAKRYSQGQIISVLMLTLGVVAAAMADARAKGQSVHVEGGSRMTTMIGFTILAVAMILSAFQGIYADRLYETYGRNHWKEALFYSHILSLPLFLPTYPQVATQWRTMFSSHSSNKSLAFEDSVSRERHCELPCMASIPSSMAYLSQSLLGFEHLRLMFAVIPTRLVYLLVNALTQYLCIRGVHLLSAKTSSLTVTIVLNIRKLASLLLSIYIFGNSLTPGVLIGATLVFIGGALYGFEGARGRKAPSKKE